MHKFAFIGEVWRWPGDAGWHFVNLPKAVSKKIQAVGKKYGAGFVKVEVVVGKTTWVTALFPHRKSETYLVSLKQSIRKKESIFEDSRIRVTIKLI
ncbi:MAG: DUF1905 domain-containing protein [Patescibacteria group bacterium]